MLLSNLSPNEFTTSDLLAATYASTKVWCKTAFPEDFELPFSPLIHDPIFERIDNPAKRQVSFSAPRGAGKTTLSVDYAAKCISFRDFQFVVFICANQDMAIRQTESLKSVLRTNAFIKENFNPIKTEVDSKEQWVIRYEDGWECLVLPLGWGQKIRGLNYRLSDGKSLRVCRPQLIILDDPEDDKEVKNEEIRKENMEWVFSKILKTIDHTKPYKVMVIGTLLHEDCMLVRLGDTPSWDCVRLEICDDDLHSHWPEKWPDEWIKDQYEDHKARGLLDVFYREFRNLPVSSEGNFRPEMFKDYDESDLIGKAIDNILIIDPAKTAQMNSAYSAIVVVGIENLVDNKIYFRNELHDRWTPDQLIDTALDLAVRYHASVIGIEVTGLENWILYPFVNRMISRGLHFQIEELKTRGVQKEDRIRSGLLPLYKAGLIYHNKDASKALEAQLLAFPKSRYKDVMDAFSYVDELLVRGYKFFNSKEDMDLGSEDEFAELEREKLPPLGRSVLVV